MKEGSVIINRLLPVIPRKKQRVCCYCRVSTLLVSQETSIVGQREHYEALIRDNPEWEFAGIYLEAGVSGTGTKGRPELQRLLADCRAGKIDLILTKSISRFARNTLDCLGMVRLLTSLGVAIHFEKERICTEKMSSEFLLSILACLAENESRSISGNMKWSILRRFQSGTYRQALVPYGYRRVDGRLVVVPEEAERVREIFSLSLRGIGAGRIAGEFNRRRIRAVRGGKWCGVTIREILKNPFYTGAVLYQKSFKDEAFRQRSNRGELDRYLHPDHHEAIISREVFEKAQSMTAERGREVGYNGTEQKRGAKRYSFSGILFCGVCGAVMYRQVRGDGAVSWRCSRNCRRREHSGMKSAGDEDLKLAFLNCLNKIAWSQERGEGVLDVYEEALRKKEEEENGERLWELERKWQLNRREAETLTAEAAWEMSFPEYREKELLLLWQGRELAAEKRRILGVRESGGSLLAFRRWIGSWRITDNPAAFPEESFSELVEKATVLSGERVTFSFRCGLRLTESMKRESGEERCRRRISGTGQGSPLASGSRTVWL